MLLGDADIGLYASFWEPVVQSVGEKFLASWTRAAKEPERRQGTGVAGGCLEREAEV